MVPQIIHRYYLGTTVVNAHFLHKTTTGNKELEITEFREKILREIIIKYPRRSNQVSQPVDAPTTSGNVSKPENHQLVLNMIGNTSKTTNVSRSMDEKLLLWMENSNFPRRLKEYVSCVMS
ncbi:hypothetical protein JTB14_022603 [Gonioctena quinquepunctata]|nr:hypothetical protein JTB14_022603 [Gonioctena quinquepunctata]